MSPVAAAGVMLILVPVAFNVAFAALAAVFDYPDVLRRPTTEVLAEFRAGGTSLVLLWWAFALTALLLAPLAVLTAHATTGADVTLRSLAGAVGVMAALVQALGLVRWPFLVPYLARVDGSLTSTPAQRESVEVVFQAFHRFLGVAVGEHLGYLLTGTWSVLVGVTITQSSVAPVWLGVVGIVIGAVLAVCSLEFVGPFEEAGWSVVGRLTPPAYVAWSVWLVACGIAFLVR